MNHFFMNNTIKKPILYTFRRCPYAIRAMIALQYSNITYEHREVILKDKPQSLLNYSAKGSVPVLVLETGQVIQESLDIVYWALQRHDPDNWANKEKSNTIAKLISENDFNFKYNLDRYKYPNRYNLNDSTDYHKLCMSFVLDLNDRLKDKKFLIENKISIADICIFPFIRQFMFVNERLFRSLNTDNIQKWVDFWLESNLFNHVMQKKDQWVDQDKTD